MTPGHAVTLGRVEPPRQGRPGWAILTIDYPRRGAEPLRVTLLARTDHEGRSIMVRSGTAPEWEAGLVWAAFRWSNENGPAELLLSWRDRPPDLRFTWRDDMHDPPPIDMPDQPPMDGLNYAEVSDVVLLASDPSARWAVRAFLDALPALGRPPGLTNIQSDEPLAVAVALRARRDRACPARCGHLRYRLEHGRRRVGPRTQAGCPLPAQPGARVRLRRGRVRPPRQAEPAGEGRQGRP